MKATSYYVSSLEFLILSFVLAPSFTTFATEEYSYVVYMGSHPQDMITLTDVDRDDRVKQNHIEFLGAFLESHDKAKKSIFYSYSKHINGFAATLSQEVASKLSNHPNVVSVFLNQGKKLHTTRSWDFLGLQNNENNIAGPLWEKAKYGENIIIGNIDTGVWPESKSFSDEGMGEIPCKWKGICQKDINKSFSCNRKLIGARYFNKGLLSLVGPLNSSFYSPRDVEGHGTHTLSTAGGNHVDGANILGFGNGTAKGGSPRARVASYKVCWPPVNENSCTDADLLAAFDMAIHDGVDVLSVSMGGPAGPFLNKGKKLHTTRSWDFLGLQDSGNNIPGSLWEKAKFGENIIIGNIDTGVWPESKSFSDEGMGEIPGKWKGTCEKDINKSFPCNRKLIGARYFNKGFISLVGPLNSNLYTPRDMDGHGSHTLSTAGGNFVYGANVLGFGNGTAKGGSPRARVASYKVFWPPVDEQSCTDADILDAFDKAIHDGVDVLSVSIGGPVVPFYEDGLAIGSFHAVKHGIVVVSSAGNSGPNLSTIENVAPWMITVGASTMDRQFPSYVIFDTTNRKLRGESLSDKSLHSNKQFPIISARKANAANVTVEQAELCLSGTLDRSKVKGKILVCLRGNNDRVDKGTQAALAGAVGMILANDKDSGDEIIADAHVLPATHISYKDGVTLFSFINSKSSPMAKLTKPTTNLGTKPAPMMAAFSSVGPNTLAPEILKPDITAPGVSIIAAYTEAQGPTGEDFDKRRVEFNSMSGTSMSCPHIAGVVGLLKSLHPEWSPAAIKSAIMTTASTMDNTLHPITNASNGKATPFNFGAGHVQPNRAMDPGLVYDLSANDYLDFLCAIGYNETLIQLISGQSHICPKVITLNNFNYPAITVPNLIGTRTVTVTRNVKNVGSSPRVTYKLAHIRNPPGISVKIEPNTLKFESVGEEKVFSIYIHANKHGAVKDYLFGEFAWLDDKNHYVRSPIVVKQNK